MGPTIQVAPPHAACVHACTAGLLLPVSAPTPLAHCPCLCLRPRCWPSVLAAQTWHGALHMRPVSTSFIAHDLPTACATFVIVPMFTGSLLAARTWRGMLHIIPHAPCEHKLHRARLTHGVCRGTVTIDRLTPCVCDRADVHRFTSRCPNLAWHAPNAPHEHELHRTRLAHDVCEVLRPDRPCVPPLRLPLSPRRRRRSGTGMRSGVVS